MDAYRYAVRDDEGRQQLTHALTPEKLSDVTATMERDTRGDWVTLRNKGQAVLVVGVDPQLADLTLWRYPIDTEGEPVSHPVRDNRTA